MSDCSQCGTCCKVITISQAHEVIRNAVLKMFPGGPKGEDRFYSDFTFIYSFWKKITRSEVLKLRPNYFKGYVDKGEYFTCTLLKDGKCSLHDKRPRVCKKHPWYGQPKSTDFGFFTNECGYKKALEKRSLKNEREGLLNPYFKVFKIPTNLLKTVISSD